MNKHIPQCKQRWDTYLNQTRQEHDTIQSEYDAARVQRDKDKKHQLANDASNVPRSSDSIIRDTKSKHSVANRRHFQSCSFGKNAQEKKRITAVIEKERRIQRSVNREQHINALRANNNNNNNNADHDMSDINDLVANIEVDRTPTICAARDCKNAQKHTKSARIRNNELCRLCKKYLCTKHKPKCSSCRSTNNMPCIMCTSRENVKCNYCNLYVCYLCQEMCY
eukprot:45371_1